MEVSLSVSSSAFVRLNGNTFDPPAFIPQQSCWVPFSERYPRFDLAYLNITEDDYEVYLFQASISSFSRHNRGTARIEVSFEERNRTEKQLSQLLTKLFNKKIIVQSVFREDDPSNNVTDFTVRDEYGNSYREKVFLVYVSPLSWDVAIGRNPPSYLYFLTRDLFPETFQSYLGFRWAKKRRKE
jgi:hypothetical protein